MDLNQKTALITGGTMGLGAAMAVDLARHGADVAVVARNPQPAADVVQTKVASLGRECLVLQGDLTQADACRDAVEQTVERFGRLDVLIHNAGGPSHGKIEDVAPEQWQATLDLHVTAAFHLCRAGLPHLRSGGEGAIVTVSSVAGIRGVPGAVTYATVKGAIVNFTRALARDVADDNIRVNCVAPGIIRTRFHDAMTEQQREHNLAHRVPLHREGTPQQVAQVVTLLVTNDYITGETYVIDGGLSMRVV